MTTSPKQCKKSIGLVRTMVGVNEIKEKVVNSIKARLVRTMIGVNTTTLQFILFDSMFSKDYDRCKYRKRNFKDRKRVSLSKDYDRCK